MKIGNECDVCLMKLLSIADYNRAEDEAVTKASYPAIRSFSPVAFRITNFPTRIQREQELIRFADIMYELADQNLWYRGIGYSPDEAAMMMAISDFVETLTRQTFDRGIRPFMCLFPPVPVWRTVNALSRGSPLRVLEIGPGSGYLGAYLIESGHIYWATDNTQSLYLWQDRFFAHLAAADFADLAAGPSDHKRVTLMPWWQFAELFRSTPPPQVDVIVCDAAMGEMDPFAVAYIVRLAASMLADFSVGAFLFRHIGEQRVNTMDYVEARFAKVGFRRTQLGHVVIHSLRDLGLTEEPPPIGKGALRSADQFLPIDTEKLLDSYAFFDYVRAAW